MVGKLVEVTCICGGLLCVVCKTLNCVNFGSHNFSVYIWDKCNA